MTLGFVSLLSVADVLIIKHYFDAETTGLYSGIATIARIIFFVTASISGVLLPHIKLTNRVEENLKTLRKAFGIIFVLGW